QGPGIAARVPPRREERRAPDLHGAGAAVRLSARRLRAGGGGLLVAGHRLSPEPGHLPAGHSGAAGRDPGARHLLRAPQPRRRPAADAGRSAHRAPLMALVTALPQDTEPVAQAPISYWRAVGWRLARDPATLVAGSLLLMIV